MAVLNQGGSMSDWKSRLRFAIILLVVSLPVFLYSSRIPSQIKALPLYSPTTPPLITLTNTGFDITELTITAGMRVSFHNGTNTSHTLIGEAGSEISLTTLFLPLIIKSANSAQSTNNEPVTITPDLIRVGNSSGNDRCQFQIPFPPAFLHP